MKTVVLKFGGTSVGSIDLNMEPTDAVEDFEVAFRYLFFEARTTT